MTQPVNHIPVEGLRKHIKDQIFMFNVDMHNV